MARITGVDIPSKKRGEIALTYIHGVGRSLSKEILGKAKVKLDKKAENWTDEELFRIRDIISQEYAIEGQLKSETQLNTKRLMDIACYRGIRHRRGLPVKGQKTKNNCRTRKGKRKTVANKKKATK